MVFVFVIDQRTNNEKVSGKRSGIIIIAAEPGKEKQRNGGRKDTGDTCPRRTAGLW